MRSTTDPTLRSFLDVLPDSEFPIQNLPYGVFVPPGGAPPRVGVRIGELVLDLAVLEERGLLGGSELRERWLFHRATLAPFMAAGPRAWRAARAQISRLLREDVGELRDDTALRDRALVPAGAVTMLLPCAIGDFTDFYASRAHAAAVGRLFRGPDAALPPAYLHLPIAYHGRASSIVVSGTPIRRPCGQFRRARTRSAATGLGCSANSPEAGDDAAPEFGPTRELDFELELGLLIGPPNEPGRPIPVAAAEEHIFGYVLVNDWSARDIQQWEYVPLGPFAGKNFATTVSPWVVTPAALEPFRCPGPPQEPPPPEYLRAPEPRGLDIVVEAALQPGGGANASVTISRTNARELYWSPAQMIAHHTANGCPLRTGDLLASGTISGEAPGSGDPHGHGLPGAAGCLLELTARGTRPLELPGGATRAFLEDGDTVILRGWCEGAGYRVGFGACAGTTIAT